MPHRDRVEKPVLGPPVKHHRPAPRLDAERRKALNLAISQIEKQLGKGSFSVKGRGLFLKLPA